VNEHVFEFSIHLQKQNTNEVLFNVTCKAVECLSSSDDKKEKLEEFNLL
jgi:hypothetical protein